MLEEWDEFEFGAFFKLNIIAEASRGAAARGVTAKPTGFGFVPHSRT